MSEPKWWLSPPDESGTYLYVSEGTEDCSVYAVIQGIGSLKAARLPTSEEDWGEPESLEGFLGRWYGPIPPAPPEEE